VPTVKQKKLPCAKLIPESEYDSGARARQLRHNRTADRMRWTVCADTAGAFAATPASASYRAATASLPADRFGRIAAAQALKVPALALTGHCSAGAHQPPRLRGNAQDCRPSVGSGSRRLRSRDSTEAHGPVKANFRHSLDAAAEKGERSGGGLFSAPATVP